jgi:hypothetical protein
MAGEIEESQRLGYGLLAPSGPFSVNKLFLQCDQASSLY